jgi:dihydrofolate synthase / folylpolyglutamate synthase
VSDAGSDIILNRLMTLHPKIIDLVLDRVERLLAALGHPERNLPPVIHVAGTNGKGSTVAMIRAGIEAAGKTAHVYTSPHLARFHERIRVAGKLIAEDDLAAILHECEVANQGQPITYFEITTCAALLAFSRVKADFTLLEVGLGGRLDATNVVARPALSVITPVSIDHQQYLGDTLPEIAGEKAGILKRLVPAIIGKQQDSALEVIETRGERLGCAMSVYGRDWMVWEEHGRMAFQDQSGLLDLPLPNLVGAHQIENAGIALAALRFLGCSDAECARGVTQAEWPARLQRLQNGPLVQAAGTCELWLDGGHNEGAGFALAEAVTRLHARPLHLICGMLRTKDVRGYLRPMAKVASSLHGVSIPGEAATLSGAETVAAAVSCGMIAVEASDVREAILDIAKENPQSRILICGSLYLAGSVLRQND